MKKSVFTVLKPLFLILITLLIFQIKPQTALGLSSGDYEYRVTDGSATITAYKGSGTDITIPATLDGYPVTDIGTAAFAFAKFESVTIADSIKNIGVQSFFECTNLTSITIPNSVISISREAFYNCTSLESVTIGNGVTSIGFAAFDSCDNLNSVTIGNSVTSIGGWAFAGSSLKSVIIPNSVTSIDLGAFASCTNLTTVSLPDSITSIGERSFAWCSNLKSITIPKGVKNIGDRAFYACSKLTTINVSSANTAYSSVNGVLYNESKTILKSYPNGKSDSSFTIPNNVTSIADWAFAASSNLKSVTMPNTVKSIGDFAFEGCTSLTSIMIPYSVTKIEDCAFYGCSSLIHAKFFGNAPIMGSQVFKNSASNFKVYYKIGKTGFTNPWHGYSTESFVEPMYNLKASSTGYNSIKLSWIPVPEASGYKIYRSTSSTGTYSLVSTAASTSFTNTGLTTGKIYYYKVRSYRTVGTSKIDGSYSSVVSAKPIPAIPKNVQAISAGYTSIKISWSSVTGASGYKIYRSTSSTGTYSLVSTSTSTSFTNAGLITGKLYYYKVRAYKTVGTSKVDGNYCSTVSAKPIPSAPSVKASSLEYNSIKISWNSVPGASGYEIYRIPSNTGSYALISTTKSTSFTNTGLATGATYYYKVRAYRTVGTTKIYGSYSSPASTKPVPSTPSSLTAARTSPTSIKLAWNKVSGATGYQIYRATSAAGTYSNLVTTSNLYYTNTGLTTGKKYYYKVRAYRLVGDTKVYGNWSSIVYAVP
jgi:fibronectin type 3 domain-containing protein